MARWTFCVDRRSRFILVFHLSTLIPSFIFPSSCYPNKQGASTVLGIFQTIPSTVVFTPNSYYWYCTNIYRGYRGKGTKSNQPHPTRTPPPPANSPRIYMWYRYMPSPVKYLPYFIRCVTGRTRCTLATFDEIAEMERTQAHCSFLPAKHIMRALQLLLLALRVCAPNSPTLLTNKNSGKPRRLNHPTSSMTAR